MMYEILKSIHQTREAKTWGIWEVFDMLYLNFADYFNVLFFQ